MLRFVIHISVLFLLLFLASCQKQDTEYLKKGVIYCSEGNPENFNPQLVNSATTLDATSQQLYNTLLSIDETDGTFVEELASHWQVSDNGLSYIFQLRRDVALHQTDYFTPTRTLTTDDIIFSFNRWRLNSHPYHDIGGGIYPYFDSIQLNETIKNIVKVSDYVIRFDLHHPDSTFLSHIASDYAVILSAEYGEHLLSINKPEQIDSQPIGTGPFKYVNYQKDSHIRYHTHDHYWEGRPKIDKLIFDITTQGSTRLAKLLTKACDVIAYPMASEMQIMDQSSYIDLQAQAATNTAFWAFNTINPPFDDPKVRLALSMAVDKKAIMRAVYYGSAFPAHSLLPPLSWAYHPGIKSPEYNPQKAQNLLREAGIPFGFTMDIWATPIERPYNPNALKMAELISQDLAQIGVKVNVVSYEWTTFRRALSESKHDSVLIGWAADGSDPDSFFRPVLSCAATIVGANRAVWCNQEFDNLINLAIASEEEDERRVFYLKAQEIIREQLPILPIAHSMRFQAKQSNVTNIEFSPFTAIGFKNVEKR